MVGELPVHPAQVVHDVAAADDVVGGPVNRFGRISLDRDVIGTGVAFAVFDRNDMPNGHGGRRRQRDRCGGTSRLIDDQERFVDDTGVANGREDGRVTSDR